MNQKFNSRIIYLLLLFIASLVSLGFYTQFTNIINTTHEQITKNEMQRAREYSNKIAKLLLKHSSHNLYQVLKYNEHIRTQLEEKLGVLKSSKYANIFVLRKDKKNKLRYLLDAETNGEDRGEFGQKFDPQNAIWDKMFQTKKPQFDRQQNIKELWISYIFPVLKNNEIIAIIVFDFSIDTYDEISSVLYPIRQFLLYFVIFTIILFASNLMQLYLYYRQNLKNCKDSLTQAYNRRYLEKMIKKIDLQDYIIAMADIDHFKSVNDRYGHNVGDRALQIFAKRIQNHLKKKDSLIRYGGEEFIIFLYKQDINNAKSVFERLKQSIQQDSICVNDVCINITSSFGVNLNPSLSKDFSKALQIADEQLYIAKNNGRNRIEYYDVC